VDAEQPSHLLTAEALRARILQRLSGTKSGQNDEPWLAGLPPELTASYRHLMPQTPIPAAVLVPIVDHGSELTILLTQRAADLKHHAGQISFPGGRVEPDDRDATDAALRESREEIGLSETKVQILGYLPDHLIVSGYRVTPVVGLVRPPLDLHLDTTEVTEAFEVPLVFLLDPANHKARRRQIGEGEIEVYDIPYRARNIWGATAGMLMTLGRSLQA